jgi:hypothetical protein
MEITVNGVVDMTAADPIELAYVAGYVYYMNSTTSWYSKIKASDPWVLVTDPFIAPGGIVGAQAVA